MIEPIKARATFREYSCDLPKVEARWRQHAVAICMEVSSADTEMVSDQVFPKPELAKGGQLTELRIEFHSAMEECRAQSYHAQAVVEAVRCP